MIHVSTEFQELMKERTDFHCFAAVTLSDGSELTLSARDFTMGGNSVTDGAGAAGLPLGAAICRTVRLSLANQDGKLDGYDFLGAKVRLYLTFALSETEERIELGTFTVTEPESRGETVTVTAADDMYRTDRPYATALSYPATLGAMFREVCDSCGVTYSTAAFVNSGFTVREAPGTEYTCRQVLGFIAMLAGGSARVHRDGRMEILSYDPEKAPEHELRDWITLTPDTDDVTVTGLETQDSEGNRVLEGSEGYVLTVEDPLMAGQEAAALAAMGARLIGLRVRRFEGEYIGYPLAECMDTARITDRKGNVFETVLTDVTFTFGGRTALSNSAAPAVRNAGTYKTPEAKARQAARELVAAERTARQAAVAALNERLSKASGMYGTRQAQPDGSSIWYLHDKPELGQSQAVMKLTSDAIGFSTDGGKSYPFGFTVTGEMVMGIIRSEGISADWVKVGGEGLGAVLEGFVGRDENDQIVSMLNASADQINIRGNRFVLDSDNFKVAADGTVTAKNGQFAGRVSSSGTWPDGVHTLLIEDSRLNISIGSKRNLSIGQTAGSGGSVAGSYISIYSGDNDNGVLLDDDARKTDVVGGYIHVGVDKNGTAKGSINCGSLDASGAITAAGGITAGSGITATCGKRKLSLAGGLGGTYEGLYSPDLGQWLLTIEEDKSVRLLGRADSATELAVARKINDVLFDGSKDITVADKTKLALTGGTMTGRVDFKLGADNQNAIHIYSADGSSYCEVGQNNGLFYFGVRDSDSITTRRVLQIRSGTHSALTNAIGLWDTETSTWIPLYGKHNLTIDTLGGVKKAGDTMTGALNIGKSLKLWEDTEGGNITINPPSSYKNTWQIDAYNGNLRIIDFGTDGTKVPLTLKTGGGGTIDATATSANSTPRIISQDLTDKTVNINGYDYRSSSSAAGHIEYYVCRTQSGSANITGRPYSDQEPFLLICRNVRWAGNTDYVTEQRYLGANTKKEYQRWSVAGTWTTWTQVCTYWKNGDTLTMTAKVLNGYVSNGGKEIVFICPVGRPITAAGVKVTKLSGRLRGVSGYVESDADVNLMVSGYTVSATVQKEDGAVLFHVGKTASAFKDVVNNTPISFRGDITLSFNNTASDEPLPGPEIFDDGGMEGPSLQADEEQAYAPEESAQPQEDEQGEEAETV